MQIPVLNFSGGEVSSSMYGRLDQQLYAASGKRMENIVPRTQGPMVGRSGTTFVHPTASNNVARVERFKFSDTQVFVLEFSDSKLRIYEDAALTLNSSSKNITAATQANPVVITSVAHGFVNGNEVYIAGVVGMTQLNGRFFRVANKTNDTFELTDLFGHNVNGTAFTAWSSGGTITKVYEVVSPYSAAELDHFDMAQAANVAYTMHRSHDIYKLTRASATSWTFATYSRTSDPFTGSGKWPGTGTFFEGRLVLASTTDNPDGMWASMSPDDDGTQRYDDFTNAASAADEAIAIPLSGPQGDVETVTWIRAARKYIAAGTPNGIVSIDGGEQGAAMTPTTVRVRPVDPYGVQPVWPIAAGTVIYYVQKGGKLLRSLEYELLSDADKSFDRSFVADHIAGLGTITKIALQRGVPDVIWGITSLGELFGLTLKAKEDVSGWHRYKIGGATDVISLTTEPRTDAFDRIWFVVTRTINSTTVRYLEYLTEPFKGVDFISYYTGDKTEDREAFVNEMFEVQRQIKYLDAHLIFDGSSRGTITMTPAATTGDDIVFTASASLFTAADVGKEIHKKYANRLGGGRALITEYTNATHVKCQILIDFDTTSVIIAGAWYMTSVAITGLYHLEGATVRILADGRVHPDAVVSAGAVSLDFQAGYVAIGFSYRQLWQSLPVAFIAQNGNSLTRKRNVVGFDVLYYNSIGLKFGTDVYDLQDIPPSRFGQLPDRPPLPVTGVEKSTNAVEWSEDTCIFIVQEQPYPCFINAIGLELEVGDQ